MKILYLNKGVSLNHLKKYKEAIECFNEGIKLNPNDASLYNNKGLSYFLLKKYEESIENQNKSIELNNKDPSL